MMIKKLGWLLVCAAALGAGVYAGNSRLQTGTPTASEMAAAALPRWSSYTFADSQGRDFALKQLEGKTVLINFWATWCPPCVEEMPDFDRLHPKLKANGIELIGIGIDSPSNIREFLEKRQFLYPLLVAGAQGSDMAKLLGNQTGSLPYTVLINPKGDVVFSKLGRITPEEVLKATGLGK